MTEWITVSEASRKAHVSDRTIRNWIAKARIVAKKEKGQWLIDDNSLSEIGNAISDSSGKSERLQSVSVPLEHYDGLTTRLGQLNAENNQYKLMLEAHDNKVEQLESDLKSRRGEISRLQKELEYHKQPFYQRWFHKKGE